MMKMILTMISLFSYIYGVIQDPPVQDPEPIPLYSGIASWYDYSLDFSGWEDWSKRKDTCALRIYERYQTFLVCSDVTWKCVECYHNDYGPARMDRVIDLSSHAFKELGVPLSRGLTPVTIYPVN